ncbi:MAG: methyltransferase domain-containing protein [Desulfarculaceae bacterium]|jgi:2-polyprenyl-3-methyl-5-hydroxy-6-metoxy-1,4-benzoquinol methylase
MNDRIPHQVSVKDVKQFWDTHPLLSYELESEPGTPEFFKEYDAIRAEQEFKYCFHLLEMQPGLGVNKVLDVGCGNAWLLAQYAQKGMKVTGIDMSSKAVSISRARFQHMKIKGEFLCASAEDIPFADNSFDIVTSLGVIHHTPRTVRCAQEIIRVCKPGGQVIIAVYYENLLVKKWFFPLTRLGLKIMGEKNRSKLTLNEFVRQYDGPDNPLAKVYTLKQARQLVKGLDNLRHEVHYFPRRFVPGLASMPLQKSLERLLDSKLGFLIYLIGNKPA